MSKKAWMLAAMAGMLAAPNDLYGAPLLPANRPREDKRTNEEKKKCKSCKHFLKERDGRCSCAIYSRVSYMVYPMAVACGAYKKRNK
jgi:hypothetical protein